jgi:hypothetical protein
MIISAIAYRIISSESCRILDYTYHLLHPRVAKQIKRSLEERFLTATKRYPCNKKLSISLSHGVMVFMKYPHGSHSHLPPHAVAVQSLSGHVPPQLKNRSIQRIALILSSTWLQALLFIPTRFAPCSEYPLRRGPI